MCVCACVCVCVYLFHCVYEFKSDVCIPAGVNGIAKLHGCIHTCSGNLAAKYFGQGALIAL